MLSSNHLIEVHIIIEPLVQIINTETKHIINGSGELHLEIWLKDLVDNYAKIPITQSDPFIK